MKNYREEAKNYFESLSRSELIEVLKDAGFEVEDGSGEVIYLDRIPMKKKKVGKANVTIRNKGKYKHIDE